MHGFIWSQITVSASTQNVEISRSPVGSRQGWSFETWLLRVAQGWTWCSSLYR